MAYDDDDRSVQDSEPYYLVTLTYPGGVVRYNSSDINIAVDADANAIVETFVRAQLSAGSLLVKPSTEMREYEVTLPISDPIVEYYKTGGPPPRALQIDVWRYQMVSGQVRREASGYAAGLALSPKTQTATFRIPDATDDHMDVLIPTVALSRTCNAFLYDSKCRVNKATYTEARTIAGISADGLTITFSGLAVFAPNWKHGLLEHVSSTEQRSIVDHFPTGVVVNLPFRNPQIGDAINVSQGCARTIEVCDNTFDNVINFRGHPRAPLQNPFLVGTTNVKKIP